MANTKSVSRRRLRILFYFLALNILLIALYLNFFKKESPEIPVVRQELPQKTLNTLNTTTGNN